MSESTERLLVRIDATTEQLRRELKKADDAVAGSAGKMESAVSRIQKSFSGLGAVIGAAGLGLAFRKVFAATAEQERVTAQLNATLLSTGGVAGKTADELIQTAAGLQKMTRYGDEAIIGMQSLLLTFKDIKGDNFDRTTKAVLDMSTAMGQDLKSSAVQLGKALNDPITGLSSLSRVGVTFSDGQKEIIKTMAETGRMAEAQVLILQELESEFGGSAEAARNTLGGALEGLGNAFDDLFEAQGSALAPMKESLNELEGILSDPAFVDAVQQITSAIINMGAAAARALPEVVDFARTIGEDMARAIGGIASDDIPALERRIAGLKGHLAQMAESGQTAGWTVEGLKNEIAELEAQLDIGKKFNEGLTKPAENAAKAAASEAAALEDIIVLSKRASTSKKTYIAQVKALSKSIDDLGKRHEKANESITSGIAELDDLVKVTDRYIEDLEFEVSLLGKSERAQALLTAEREHAGRATEEQRAKVLQLTATLYDAEEATRAAAEAQKPFQDALQGTVERIDTAFASAWQGAFDSFQDFADGIKASFQQLIGELLHMAITRPIVMSFGAALTGGSAGAAASGGASSLFSGGISSIGSAAASYLTAPYYTNTGLQFAVPGDGGAALTPQFSWANAGASLGGGLVGSYIGSQVYGPTSGIGSAAGGLGGAALGAQYGAALGPIGIAIGAALGAFGGGFVESLFGGNNNGDNKGRADLNFGTGQSSIYGVGNSFNQANVDALSQIAPILQQFADAIGGSQAMLNLSAGNNSGLRLNGTRYGSPDELISAAIKEIVAGANVLSSTLKKLVSNFSGTADEVAAFSGAILSISQQLEQNPVTQAIADFTAASELSGKTSKQLYNEQRKNLDDLIYSFDGSAAAAVSLNNALMQNRTAAYEMAIAIEQIGKSINQTANDSIAYFQESTRTPDEQLQYMQKQLEFGAALLPGIKDPAQLAEAGQFLLDLNKKIFDAGPDDLQRANVGTFIDFADFVRDTITERLGLMSNAIEVDQGNLSQQIGAMLEVSAAGFQAPADTMMSAAQMMYLAVQNFINNGGSQYSQVVA